jgi:hypothetical protein
VSSIFSATVARRRIFSSFCSLAQSVNALVRGLAVFVDILIGLPNLKTVDLDQKLKLERARSIGFHYFVIKAYLHKQ